MFCKKIIKLKGFLGLNCKNSEIFIVKFLFYFDMYLCLLGLMYKVIDDVEGDCVIEFDIVVIN